MKYRRYFRYRRTKDQAPSNSYDPDILKPRPIKHLLIQAGIGLVIIVICLVIGFATDSSSDVLSFFLIVGVFLILNVISSYRDGRKYSPQSAGDDDDLSNEADR